MAEKDEDRVYRKYKRLTQEQKMELRKIARSLGVHLQTVQYHLKKTNRI